MNYHFNVIGWWKNRATGQIIFREPMEPSPRKGRRIDGGST